MSLNKTAFGCGDLGSNTVTLTVTDANGAVSTGTAAVTVEDRIAPTALANDIAVQLDASGNASITGAQLDNGSSDNCSVASVAVAPSAFTCANVGANPVTVTVTDASGNQSTAAATVTVLDQVAPTAVAQNVTVQLDVNGTASVTAGQLNNGSADNCGALTFTVDAPTQGTVGGLVGEGGVLTLTAPAGTVFTAVTFASYGSPGGSAGAFATGGCQAATSRSVVESYLIGQNSANIPANNSIFGDPCVGTYKALAVQATYGVVAPASQLSFGCTSVGTNPVVLTVTDASGNQSTAAATVTVVDNILPTITAPAAVTVSTDAGQCTASNVALGTAPAADNCSVTVTNNAPATFNKGVTTVTWTATDASGNVATATQTVTVNDTELPTISAPAAVVTVADANQCSASGVVLGNATAGDNCAGVVVSNNAPATFGKGNTTVTWTATDAAGNKATATQVVTVKDTQNPVLSTLANIVASAPATQCSAVVTFNPTATDNCADATVTTSVASGSTFAVGTTTVNVTATDASGNSSTGSFTVTVNDVTAPTAVTRNVPVTLVDGKASVTVADVNNGSSDACGIRSMTLSRTNFTCADIGNKDVILTVTDVHGLVSTATAVVTVTGTIPTPAITVTPSSSVYTGGVATNLYLGYGAQSVTLTATGGVSYVWSPATGLSNSKVANPTFTASTAGTVTYTVTATSASGCTATKEVTLRVLDARCGNNNDKVLVCHNGHEICISPNAVGTHLSGHGDQLGACSGNGARSVAAEPAATLANELAVYPNPARDQATVSFRTALNGPAQVVVYNQLGQRIATLYDGTATAGQLYSLTLNSQNLASGLYVCRLVANGKTEMLRLTIAR